MSPEAIVGLTAAISIAFNYLEPVHPNLQMAQNLQERAIQRLRLSDHGMQGLASAGWEAEVHGQWVVALDAIK